MPDRLGALLVALELVVGVRVAGLVGVAAGTVIARAHGGSAGAANRVPHGADVWIALPLIGDVGTIAA